MKIVAVVGARALATVHQEEVARALDAMQDLLVASGTAMPGPIEIRAHDPVAWSAPNIIPRPRKRKGRGRHKANRWR